MRMTFYTANCRGNAMNNLYPNKRVADNEEDFLEIIAFDHVCETFKGFRRSGDNFHSCDVDVMDCDNDHSEDPAEWIHPRGTGRKNRVGCGLCCRPSRSNMTPKDGKTARPRFHVYFPYDPITDGVSCTALKRAIQQKAALFSRVKSEADC